MPSASTGAMATIPGSILTNTCEGSALARSAGNCLLALERVQDGNVEGNLRHERRSCSHVRHVEARTSKLFQAPRCEGRHCARVHAGYEIRVAFSATQRTANVLWLGAPGQSLHQLSSHVALHVSETDRRYFSGPKKADAGQDLFQFQGCSRP